MDTVPLALFEQLDLSFLDRFDVFAPDSRGRPVDFEPVGLVLAPSVRFYTDIYGQRAVYRTLQDETVWRQCGFPRTPSRDPIPDREVTAFVLAFNIPLME